MDKTGLLNFQSDRNNYQVCSCFGECEVLSRILIIQPEKNHPLLLHTRKLQLSKATKIHKKTHIILHRCSLPLGKWQRASGERMLLFIVVRFLTMRSS